jgi:large subunit ribosomal protein L10
VMDGKVLGADEVRRLATLESREVLLARLAGLLQASAQQTVNLLAAPLRQVATMTAALRDKKAEEGPAEGAEAAAPAEATAEATEPEAPAAEAADTTDTTPSAAEAAGDES